MSGLSKGDFSRLVFSRRRPDEFQSIILFNVNPKSTVALEQHYFYAGMAIHALDINAQYASVIPHQFPGVDLRCAIQHLSELFEHQTFEKDLIHDIMLVVMKPFTTAVGNFFKQQHPAIALSIDEFLKEKHKNHMREKRKNMKSKQPVAINEQRQKDRAKLDAVQKAQSNSENRQQKQAAAQRERDRIQALADADPEDPLLKVYPPNMEWFKDVDKNPMRALLLFAWNTGHAYLPALTNGVLPHSSEWPDIMSEAYSPELELPPEVHALHSAILGLQVTQETIDERIAQFTQRIKLRGFLPACGSCGIRHCFVDEGNLAEPTRDHDKTDLFSTKPDPPPFVRLSLDDPLIAVLRLSDDQIRERENSGYKTVFSAYEDVRGGVLKAVLHLHPQLIEPDAAGSAPSIMICAECLDYMRKLKKRNELERPRAKDTECNVRRALNRTMAIAQGFDYGHLVGCPELSLLEKTLISQYVFFGSLVKLNAWRGVRQNALKGHIICFSHTGPNAINRVCTLLFPWFSHSEILECIKVSFVGPRGVADRCLKALCLDSGLLRVDIVPLAWWLGLLKACHPGYAHMQLPTQQDKDEAQARLLQLQAKIVSQAQMVHSKLSRRIEKRAGADIANVRCLPEDHDLDVEDDLDSDSSQSDSDAADGPERCVDLDDPQMQEKLNFMLSDTMIVENNVVPEDNPSDIMKALLSMLDQNPDAPEPPQMAFRSVRSENPINEYGNTDILFYYAMPCLFPFGRGLPDNSSALSNKVVRHLLLQFHARHAKDQRFLFAQFNQLQRHAASRAAVIRVRNSKEAVNQFTGLIHEPGFRLRLSQAVDDPDSDDAKLLARQVLPLITSVGATIPYSPSERKDMFSRYCCLALIALSNM